MLLFFFNRYPFREADAGGAGEPAFAGTPQGTDPGPAPTEGQPTDTDNVPQSQFAQYMGLDLSSIPEHERPVMVERLKQIDAKFTPAMQEVAELRKVAEQYDMTPKQMAGLVQAIQSKPEVITQLFQQPQQQQAPTEPAPPPDNVYLQDPDMRTAVEYLAKQMVKGQQEELGSYKSRVDALLSTFVTNAVEKQAEAFLTKHQEYGLSVDQLKQAALEIGPSLKLKPEDPRLMAFAAVHALGGLDPITEKAGAAKVQAYINQSKSNSKVGTTVQSGAPANVAPDNSTSIKDPAFKRKLVGMLEAVENARR